MAAAAVACLSALLLLSAAVSAAAQCRSAAGELVDTLYTPPGFPPTAPISTAADQGGEAEYASAHSWFAANEPIEYGGKTYIRFGVPRRFVAISAAEQWQDRIARIGSHDRVPVFVEPDRQASGMIYLLSARGCEFQMYVDQSKLRINYGPPTVVADPVPGYLAILEHLRAMDGSLARYPLVLSDAVIRWPGDRGDPAAPLHAPGTLRALREAGGVRETCSGSAVPRCEREGAYILLELGYVEGPPAGRESAPSTVRIPSRDRAPGESLGTQIDAIPNSAAVPYRHNVDVDVTIRCAVTGDPGVCEPGHRRYMYFLRLKPDGSPMVVGRWLLDP
jgi:hypothetical protein